MSRIFGTILSIGDFFKIEDAIIFSPGYEANQIFSLLANRKYIIPDYQREIRWKKEHLIELLSDISRGNKFLGNIILNKRNDLEYEVIDGQQRITTLLMTIYYIRSQFSRQIDIFNTCKLEIASFNKFELLIENKFDFDSMSVENREKIEESDVFNQCERYVELWGVFQSIDWLQTVGACEDFLSQIRRSQINLIVNTDDNDNYSIDYFLDVNLKGVKLDNEDIFKGYLFRQDSSQEIRNEWNSFKIKSFRLNNLTEYPITKLLEHYFYCDLYKNEKFKSMKFGEDFLITEIELEGVKHYTGEHLIKVIRDKSYMLESLKNINRFLGIVLEVLNSESPSQPFKELFNPDANVDNDEVTIIHNLIRKIMLDKNVVPRILIMKYVMEILFVREDKSKDDYRKIYGVYLLAITFTVFEGEKDVKKVLGVVKDLDWYTKAIEQSKNYFSSNKISKSRITAQYKLINAGDQENYMFRCKSLATIYNFLEINNNTVKVTNGKVKALKVYISDSEKFSHEHFIINKSGEYNNLGQKNKYPPGIRRYANSIFNYIFIPRELNGALENHILSEKIRIIDEKAVDTPDQIKCEFSKMIIDRCRSDFQSPNEITDIEKYYNDGFVDEFSSYALEVIKKIGERLGAN